MEKELKSSEDVWIPTACGRCYACCGIRVRRVDGVAVKIDGEPNTKMGAEGGVCGKSLAGLQVLYDPNRLNVPLKRTNPEKGLYADPKWKAITWEEALDEIETRLRKIMSENPQKILFQGTAQRAPKMAMCVFFALQFALCTHDFSYPGGRHDKRMRWWHLPDAPTSWSGGGGLHCGNGAHAAAGMVHGAWSIVPDFDYCDYAILFGAGKGCGSGHSAMQNVRKLAKAKARGLKFVVFDPMCNTSGARATEWIPLIPGTDGAIALGMANVIVNELGIKDDLFLKLKTNAPYLIGPDGRYVRDRDTRKPLVWDAGESKSKVYDDPAIKDFALEGEYEVDGIKCQPGFQAVKEHLKQYTPEMVSKISTVPAETIHRIAVEFAQAARVGSTITIDGKQLPYRPAAATIFRGGEGHYNSFHTCMAVSILNQIVGNCDVPGGLLGWPAVSAGYPGTGRLKWTVWKGVDGMLTTDHFFSFMPGPWPHHEPAWPTEAGLQQLFTLAPFTFTFASSDQEELWQKVNLPYRPEMLINWGNNSVMSVANPEIVAEALKKIPFIVHFDLFETEFSTGFADLVLPDVFYLEEEGIASGLCWNISYPPGLDDWTFHITQKVVEPKGSRRDVTDVLYELVDRLGRRAELNDYWNIIAGFDEADKLKPGEKLSFTEISDKILKYWFGPEHDWQYFKKHGFITWRKKVEEAYWRYFTDCRVPFYQEYVLETGEKIKELNKKIGLKVDLSPYTPLVSWHPSPIHTLEDSVHDLYCFSYRDALHVGSMTMEQPWIDEAGLMNPYTYNITLNRDTAQKKGLKEGDIIELESSAGRKVTGVLKMLEGQHPQTVGIAATAGHWGRGQPVARGKGTHFDTLLELDLQHVDPLSLNIETCVRVKVSKAERS